MKKKASDRHKTHQGMFWLCVTLVCGTISSLSPSASAKAEVAPHGVALTFDDLPYVTRDTLSPSEAQDAAVKANDAILAVLRQEGIAVTAFVNESKVEALGSVGPQILSQWNQGTLQLANHGYHHFDSNKLSLQEIEAEIVRGEATIRPMAEKAGRQLEFFRFPYNHAGNTEARRGALSGILHRHGYRLAATTIDVEDYIFNDAYECALSRHRHDDASRVVQAYLDYIRIEVPYYRVLDAKVMGHEIPEIMLLHSNALNAAVLPAVIAIFKADHTRFISLADAQSDPAYAHEPKTATAYGPMWGYRWANERHIPVDGSLEKEASQWVVSYCDRSGRAR